MVLNLVSSLYDDHVSQLQHAKTKRYRELEEKLANYGEKKPTILGDGPNTVSEGTVSNTELSEFFCPHRVLGRELSEFLSASYLCDKANSPSFSQNSPSLPQNSVRLSEFPSPKQHSRNSIPPVSYI